MNITFSYGPWSDFGSWQFQDPERSKKLIRLIRDIQRSPYSGIGKPEPLKHNLAGFWSRRIDAEHRLVYRIEGDTIWIVQCRYHY